MNEEQALKEFLREHLALLTSRDFDKHDYKRALNDFYHNKHRYKFSKPSHRDCMIGLVALLKATATEEQIHGYIDNLPFFKLTGENERRSLHDLLYSKQIQSVLPSEQIKTIRDVGAFVALEIQKGKEIAQEKQKELQALQRQIDEKRDEYESLPSILDHEDIQEPDFEPQVEEIKPWWGRFYLRGDPFPRKDGLSAISTDLYEAVIIKTQPFQTTLSSLQKNCDFLFNTGSLLVGDYGYGKTTFVDYLSHYLINRDVLPVRISSAKPFADAAGFADSFLNKFSFDLRQEARKMTALDEKALEPLELEDQIVQLCSRVLAARRKGIVVFMDDYHKFRSHFPQIFEFLGTLQILKDTLTREGLKVGFVVSGVPSWLEELQRNSQLLGFLDSPPIKLPAVSPELISAVFNKRIEAFCFESTPRRVKPDFVRQVVKDLAGEQGIRGCINRIIEELTNNNLAIVDSPVEIADEVLQGIRGLLEADNSTKAAFNKLLFESRFRRYSNEQIARCLELLVHVNVQNGISEEDRQFVENAFYFQALRNAGFIQKQKGRSGTPFKWNLSNRFAIQVKAITVKYNLNLADYLLKLYAYKEYAEKHATKFEAAQDPLREVKLFFARKDLKLEKAVYASITSGLHKLESFLLRDADAKPTESTLRAGLDALETLTQALCALDSSATLFAHAKIGDPEQMWTYRPDTTETIQEALNRVEDYKHEKSSQRLSHAIKLLADALIEVSRKLLVTGQQLCEASEPLLHRPVSHTDDELALLTSINTGFYSAVREDHFDYVRSLTDYLELRFRRYFFYMGMLVFGDKYFDFCPKAVQGYAYKNLDSRESYAAVRNQFDGLTRSQFKFIFVESNPLREHCIRTMDLQWREEDWKTFADTFAIENIKAAHQQVDSYSPQDKIRYRKYAHYAEDLMSAINRIVGRTIQRHTYVLAPSPTCGVEECSFRFFFKPLALSPNERGAAPCFEQWPAALQKQGLVAHCVAKESFDRIVRVIREKLEIGPRQVVVQDLLDTEYIYAHYRVSLPEFICVLAFVNTISKQFTVQSWFGSSVLIAKP